MARTQVKTSYPISNQLGHPNAIWVVKNRIADVGFRQFSNTSRPQICHQLTTSGEKAGIA
jgi:hypothetical protein